MNRIFLLLGGNLGNRIFYIEKACELIAQNIGSILQKSSYYESEPWGFQHDNRFVNQVVVIESSFSAQEVLRKILHIEKKLGRVRNSNGYSARTMDIDILFYNEQIITEENLVVPHPHLHKRRFTLQPLAEIQEKFVHPILRKPIVELLGECADNAVVTVI